MSRIVSPAIVQAKINARYTCQECGSTELVQAHHTIPGDDNSLIVLCAECHSNKHPDLPKRLFFTKRAQPYWNNKSASSLAREWGISSRTVIRTAKKLAIRCGELSLWDEELIRSNILTLKPKTKKTKKSTVHTPKSLEHKRMVKKLIRMGSSRVVVIPQSWLKYHEEQLGKEITEVLMELNGEIRIYVQPEDKIDK